MTRRSHVLVRSLVGVAVGALVASWLSSGGAATAAPAALAQFGIGNLLDSGKDFAVRSALSSFGKTIAGQLPIVVDPADAYPTTPTLPGPPFNAPIAPNVAATLRASSDGTVALPPGDYAFPVSVFCMRATAHSPNGHRYVVAPLHGSAADVITALDARIPSFPVSHAVLQVLSWNIQAGLPYDAMQRDQRTAVDRIIPEFRGRLKSDVLTQMRAEYEQTAGRIPGMPSFEGALGRLGPVGDAVVTLENVRGQLSQPSPRFEDLARSLVPGSPFGSVASHVVAVANGANDATPWSRYSDRVYVRFTTDGNYATPGTYQIRVLPPRRQALSAPAAVPFANIVNNPGTNDVQPLTQTPLPPPGPAPNPTPRPTPPPDLAIQSETVAEIPADRRRTLVGVGEPVHLTVVGASTADWDIASSQDGRVFPTSGREVTYYAAQQTATETITAHVPGKSAQIVFHVIPPSGLVQKVDPEVPLIHSHGYPNVGFWAYSYLTPATVSFENVGVKELDACSTASGIFDPGGHQPASGYSSITGVDPNIGSKVYGEDHNYSGTSGWVNILHALHPPYSPGAKVYDIPWVYALRTGSPDHPFATVHLEFQLESDRQTLIATKAGATVVTRVDADDAHTDKIPPGAPSGPDDGTKPAGPCDPEFQ